LLKLAADMNEPLPLDMGAAIVAGALHGLHAAHEAKGDDGEPLDLVHRDVSPENILVGVNGVPRILDFGIAKAAGRVSTTAEGKVKGKLAYMAMEQLAGEAVDRRVDVFSTGVVLWEVLTGRPRFRAPSQTALLAMALEGKLIAPSAIRPDISPELDALVLRAMDRDPAKRFATAREFAFALEELVPLASPARVGAWVEEHASETLSLRASLVANVEKSQSDPGQASNPFDDSGRGVTVISSPGSSRPGDAFAATALIDTHGDRAQLTAAEGLSVQSEEEQERKPSRWPLIALAALLVSVTGLVFALSSADEPTDGPVSPAPASPTDLVTPTGADSSPAVASPEPSALAAPSAAASASASASTSEPAVKAPPSKPATRPRRPPPKPPSKPAKTNCNPPYTVDARGVQRIKPECL
jgi:serine/threonine-protein kinase